ncbi:probable G-protein coupled receptor B0563.6 [Littorina saxatilis]|uniref:probable G-protein coupled receptor B0563.6 n=1 Tax=Littorina saxatilis TaxID=31220 RepID=UPI0038B491BC
MTTVSIFLYQAANVIEFKVTPVICSIGIVLNMVNLLVLTERGLKESPYIYLRALSLTDLSALLMTAVFLVVTTPAGSSGFITSDGTTTGDLGVFYGAYIFLPLTSICNNASTWIVITLTIERFLFVKKPLWARGMCTPSSAKLKTVVVLVVITLVNVPRFMYYRVDTATSPPHRLQIRPTVFRYSKANEKVLWLYSVMFGLVPLLILGVTNRYLIYAVKKARRQRRLLRIRNNMEAHWNREQTRLTLTLISIVCLAVVCILPAAFGDVVVMSYLFSRSATLRQFLESPFYKVFRSVSNLLLTCNMSLNFVLYSAFNDKFVRVMKKMVRRFVRVMKKMIRRFVRVMKKMIRRFVRVMKKMIRRFRPRHEEDDSQVRPRHEEDDLQRQKVRPHHEEDDSQVRPRHEEDGLQRQKVRPHHEEDDLHVGHTRVVMEGVGWAKSTWVLEPKAICRGKDRWLHQVTGKKSTLGVLFVGAGTRHKAVVKTASNASSLTTKTSNVEQSNLLLHQHHQHQHNHR